MICGCREKVAIWSFNYFFYNKKLKRILYFSCRALSKAAADQEVCEQSQGGQQQQQGNRLECSCGLAGPSMGYRSDSSCSNCRASVLSSGQQAGRAESCAQVKQTTIMGVLCALQETETSSKYVYNEDTDEDEQQKYGMANSMDV
jgi:hypothetical protein